MTNWKFRELLRSLLSSSDEELELELSEIKFLYDLMIVKDLETIFEERFVNEAVERKSVTARVQLPPIIKLDDLMIW